MGVRCDARGGIADAVEHEVIEPGVVGPDATAGDVVDDGGHG
jgi:hypothetical protein